MVGGYEGFCTGNSSVVRRCTPRLLMEPTIDVDQQVCVRAHICTGLHQKVVLQTN